MQSQSKYRPEKNVAPEVVGMKQSELTMEELHVRYSVLPECFEFHEGFISGEQYAGLIMGAMCFAVEAEDLGDSTIDVLKPFDLIGSDYQINVFNDVEGRTKVSISVDFQDNAIVLQMKNKVLAYFFWPKINDAVFNQAKAQRNQRAEQEGDIERLSAFMNYPVDVSAGGVIPDLVWSSMQNFLASPASLSVQALETRFTIADYHIRENDIDPSIVSVWDLRKAWLAYSDDKKVLLARQFEHAWREQLGMRDIGTSLSQSTLLCGLGVPFEFTLYEGFVSGHQGYSVRLADLLKQFTQPANGEAMRLAFSYLCFMAKRDDYRDIHCHAICELIKSMGIALPREYVRGDEIELVSMLSGMLNV